MKKLMKTNLILILLLQVLINFNSKPKMETVTQVAAETVKPIESVQIVSRGSRPEMEVEEITVEEKEVEKPTKCSQNCIDFVKRYESFRGQAYKLDGETYWTIGYGHHGPDVKESQTITEEQANRLIVAELEGISKSVLDYCDYLDLNQNELDALTSFAYNGGLGMLHQLTDYKKRSKEEIAEHITAYTNNGLRGLVLRRNEEKEMFLKEV